MSNEFKTPMQMLEEDRAKIAERLKDVKHILIVMSGKGGVGKSTVAANLAGALSKKNQKVGLLDADFHGPTIPIIFKLSQKPLADSSGNIMPIKTPLGIKVISLGSFLPSEEEAVIWRGPMKMGAIKQFLRDVEWGKLDYLIIDCPPGTGDEPLSLAQLISNLSGVIIVTSPQEEALAAVKKSINFARKVNLPITGIIENYAGYLCPYCGKISYPFKKDGAEKLTKLMHVELLGTIPMFANMPNNGRLIATEDDHPGSKIFYELTEKIENKLKRNDERK